MQILLSFQGFAPAGQKGKGRSTTGGAINQATSPAASLSPRHCRMALVYILMTLAGCTKQTLAIMPKLIEHTLGRKREEVCVDIAHQRLKQKEFVEKWQGL